MSVKTLYLICNAHLDPVWLWEWEEGAAEALSTYRTAAQFCEEFEEYVFNHNEALLYKYVESYEPELFKKIQRLVKEKRWHIMGGWYVQPDCNMPSGESFVRQIMTGRLYFKKKFGVEPRTAVNFDPFGHTRGLVQILKKSGYTSYLFCRPDSHWLSLPCDDFIWVGYDGSEIMAHRASAHYNSWKGKAAQRVKEWLGKVSESETSLLLWGIGNHGGGASHIDLEQLRELMTEDTGWEIRHGVPEDYFQKLSQRTDRIPRYSKDLNPWAVGCYTTMALIKQKHRNLENSYFLTEKIVTNASLQGLMVYPRKELQEALEDLLFCEFHDILPGSSIPQVEDYSIQRMDHGLEILSRLKTKAFFALLSGQSRAKEGEFPVFVYNPHPYSIKKTIVCEFQPYEPNFDMETVWVPEVSDSQGKSVPCQIEKEQSTLSVEWRKKLVFHAELMPGQMNRFSCRLRKMKSRFRKSDIENTSLIFKYSTKEIVLNTKTGFIDQYRVNGVDFLVPGSFHPLVVQDYPDPWGMKVRSFRNVKGEFSLMSEEGSAHFAGVKDDKLKPVRIIEEGPVRTVVEALFKYNQSSLCLRYKIPKKGTGFQVEVRVFWNEKDSMLKLSIPAPFRQGRCQGQVAYGVEDFGQATDELVAQKWVGIVTPDMQSALTVVNDGTYGFDFAGGELRISLLRSTAYAADCPGHTTWLVYQQGFVPRIDQGERMFRFWINGGKALERLAKIDREALVRNEKPMVLSCFPPGGGKKPVPSVMLSDEIVQVTSMKIAEKNNWVILRLFEPTGKRRKTSVSLPFFKLAFDIQLLGFEVKTIAVDLKIKDVFEVDLMEHKLKTQGSKLKSSEQ